MNNQVANRPKMSFTQFMGADVVQKKSNSNFRRKESIKFYK